MSMSESNEVGEYFSCRIDNSKLITEVLQCIYDTNKKNNVCYVEANPEALSFSISNTSKSVQTRVSFPADMFQEYAMNTVILRWTVNIALLIDCLQIYGTVSEAISSTFRYAPTEGIFEVCMEESGVLSLCQLDTLVTFDDGDENESHTKLFSSFRESVELGQIIFKADIFRDVLHDLMDNSTNSLDQLVGLSQLMQVDRTVGGIALKMCYRGSHGIDCEVIIPRASPVVVTCHCEKSWCWRYSHSAIMAALKPMISAAETCIRVNSLGSIIVQHQVKLNGPDSGIGNHGGSSAVEVFVDCAILAVAHEDDENQ